MPWLDVQGARSVHVNGFLRSLHIALILLACGAFGISAVAEGVETAEQLRVLSEMGCERGQGFYFAPPMPALELERWLATGPRWRV